MNRMQTHASRCWAAAVSLTLVLVSAIGCAPERALLSDLPVMRPGRTAIVVYRPPAFALCGAYPHIYLAGEDRGPLKNGGHLVLDVPPGTHLVEAKGSPMSWDARLGSLPVRVDVKPGETRYVRLFAAAHRPCVGDLVEAAVLGFLVGPGSASPPDITVTFNQVTREFAMKEADRCRRANQSALW